MRIDIVTLFPHMFDGWLSGGGVRRALERNLVEIGLVDLRPFGVGRHLQVDDYPFGGGPGMVLMAGPLFAAVESVPSYEAGPIILMSPRGRRFDQGIAHELAEHGRLTLIAGHYEGVDERVSRHLATDEISIGDYVLSGGELPAMVVVEAVVRLIPGAIDEESGKEESFAANLLEYPQYTRPASFRGWDVPEVLLSGHHQNVNAWRRQEAERLTRISRPDLHPDGTDQPDEV